MIDAQGIPARKCRDTRKLPVAEHGVHRFRPVLPECPFPAKRQVINVPYGQTVLHVRRGQGSLSRVVVVILISHRRPKVTSLKRIGVCQVLRPGIRGLYGQTVRVTFSDFDLQGVVAALEAVAVGVQPLVRRQNRNDAAVLRPGFQQLPELDRWRT